MRLAPYEQETIICYDRSSKFARIYTANPTDMKKLDAAKDIYKCTRVDKDGKQIIAKEYNTTRQNINFVLKSAGIYKNRLNPIVIPDNFEFEEEGTSSPQPQSLRFFLS